MLLCGELGCPTFAGCGSCAECVTDRLNGGGGFGDGFGDDFGGGFGFDSSGRLAQRKGGGGQPSGRRAAGGGRRCLRCDVVVNGNGQVEMRDGLCVKCQKGMLECHECGALVGSGAPRSRDDAGCDPAPATGPLAALDGGSPCLKQCLRCDKVVSATDRRMRSGICGECRRGMLECHRCSAIVGAVVSKKKPPPPMAKCDGCAAKKPLSQLQDGVCRPCFEQRLPCRRCSGVAWKQTVRDGYCEPCQQTMVECMGCGKLVGRNNKRMQDGVCGDCQQCGYYEETDEDDDSYY